MSQFDFGNIDPDTTSGTDLSENILEPWRDALHSCHKGSTRPSYAGQGTMWVDDSATPWLIKVYTGSTDSIIGSIAPSTGVFNVRSDVISESSSGSGVTVNGVLLKDGNVGSSSSRVSTVYADSVDIGGDSPATSGGGNFPNVDSDVTATDEDMNSVLVPYTTARVELGGDFNVGNEVICERVANTVFVTSDGILLHTNSISAASSTGAIPSSLRPSSDIVHPELNGDNNICHVTIKADGTVEVIHDTSNTNLYISLSYSIQGNIT